jgi:phosphate transport system substrate-binding protein
MALCKEKNIEYLEIPIAYDALTVVINPSNDWADKLTVAELKTIWRPEAEGKIMQWNNIQDPNAARSKTSVSFDSILVPPASANEDISPKKKSFPAVPINLFGAGSSSGTFDYFTKAINGKEKLSRSDYTATEDDNIIVNGVSRNKNALGYLGYAYYAANRNKLKAVAIQNTGSKEAILPETLQNGKYLTDNVEKGAYVPLSRPLFIYVVSKSLEKPAVNDFVNYYLKEARKASKETQYIPLPNDAYKIIGERVKAKKTGTVFEGKGTNNMTIQQIISKETQ